MKYLYFPRLTPCHPVTPLHPERSTIIIPSKMKWKILNSYRKYLSMPIGAVWDFVWRSVHTYTPFIFETVVQFNNAGCHIHPYHTQQNLMYICTKFNTSRIEGTQQSIYITDTVDKVDGRFRTTGINDYWIVIEDSLRHLSIYLSS